MKSLFTPAIFLLSFFLPIQMMANTVIVKGYVRYSDGTPAAGRPVMIGIDSMGGTAACTVQHTRTTNANGFYTDTVTCNGDIEKLHISTADCTGMLLTNTPSPASGSNTVESNFSLSCTSGISSTPSCSSSFSDSVIGNGAYFSSRATAGTNDTITSRTWVFGDSSASVTGNSPALTHSFAKPGVYTVCLYIKTAKGCESHYCNTVAITAANTTPPQCNSSFRDSILGNGGRFTSTATSNDSIVSRTWVFGDSSTYITGNTPEVTHSFAKPGVYNVCLYIKTAKGCESHYCNTVAITAASTTPPQCNSSFRDSILGNGGRFTSTATSNDSIVSRTWVFGDSSTYITGNTPEVTHSFAKPGVYNVCLYIKTAKGCESHYCNTVAITAASTTPPQCNSSFRDSILGNGGRFTSTAASNDSIVSRTWVFGDNSASVSGNSQELTHTFLQSGTYNVCLYIKTAKGCESHYCNTVTIAPPPVVAPVIGCNSHFRDTVNGSSVSFTSTATANDSITSRTWVFGDNGATLTGNSLAPVHAFTKPGSYTVCLYIKTATGCENHFCNTVTIVSPTAAPPVSCSASFRDSVSGTSVKFNGTAAANDSIISRSWVFGDSSVSTSTTLDPTHVYARAGVYNACLYIKTARGCESHYCTTITIIPPPSCQVHFTDSVKGNYAAFYSAGGTGDSIVSRSWNFGDGSAVLTGNVVNPAHQFPKPGTYDVCVSIKTASGCESKSCNNITIVPPTTASAPPACSTSFSATLTGTTVKVTTHDYLAANDSVISRSWSFGEGSESNEPTPAFVYANTGVFTVCEKIKTARGCESGFCQTVIVADSIRQNNSDAIKLISISPNPVSSQTNVTVWSRNNNVDVEYAIYDIYGNKRWSAKKTLVQGNNTVLVSTSSLAAGMYYFKVSSQYGVQSMPLYKF